MCKNQNRPFAGVLQDPVGVSFLIRLTKFDKTLTKFYEQLFYRTLTTAYENERLCVF